MNSKYLNKRLASYSLAVLCLLLSSCSTKNPLESDQNAEIVIEIIFPSHNSLKKTSSAATISRVVVTVTASDMDTIQEELTISGNRFSGDIDVILGEDRSFAVEAFDENGLVQYSGSTTVDILEDTTVPIELQAHTPESVFLMKRDVTFNSATLYWKRNADPDFSSYRLYRSQSPGVSTASELIYQTANNIDTTYTDQEITPSSDYYYKVFVFDTENLFTGSNEVMITSTGNKNITIQQVSAPPSATSGETITISWQVVNVGLETITESHLENVWINSTESLDGAELLGNGPLHTTPLSPAGILDASIVVTVPSGFVGTYYLLVQGDANNNVPESDENNNVVAREIVVVLLPIISRAPDTLTFNATEGGSDPNSQTLQISNSGGGTLNWSISDNAEWLSLAPANGTSTGETDDVAVSINIANLPAGTYNATITISDPNASNSPQTTAVTLNLAAPATIFRSPSSMSFNATQGGSNPNSKTLQISNSGGGTLHWSVSDNQSWLSLSPTSGSSTGETDNVDVSVNIAGLTAGTHNATITISDPAATNNPQTTSVTLNLAVPPATIFRSPSSMTFNATEGGANPNSQTLQISDSGGRTLNWIVSDNQSWLSLSPTSGSSTGETDNVSVSLNIAGLTAGTYNGTITISSSNANNSPQTTSVTLNQAVPPVTIFRSPGSMTFIATEGGSNPSNQTLQISNSGGGTLNWSVSDNQSWLSLSPTSGSSTGETDNVSVSVNIAGLTAGTHNATITISDPAATNNPQTTSVTLNVSEPPPTITRSPSSMTFNATEGGSNPNSKTLQISNSGGGTLNWSVSDNQSWLSLSPTSGSSTGETDNVTVRVDIANLPAGTYNGTITISGPGATNTPRTTSVTLNVSEPPPTITRSPSSITFNATEGGSNPSNRTLQISNSGGGTLNWSVSDNQSWLSLSPTSGSSTGETDNVTVRVDIANLPAGTYNGTITISSSNANNSPQTTTVTLNLAASGPAISRSPSTMTFTATEGGSDPNNQTLQISNSGQGTLNWSVSDNRPWLRLLPASGSSTGETDNVTVIVFISNLQAGTHNAIITISDPNANNSPQIVAVTLNLNTR